MHLRVQNRLTEIPRLAQLMIEFGEKEHFSRELVHDVNLVLEEVLSNIILYGYDDVELHQIELELRYDRGELVLTVQDDAKAFNPLDVPVPKLELPLEKRPVGGLGIYLIRSLMDELNYTRTQEKNVLTLKKDIRKYKAIFQK